MSNENGTNQRKTAGVRSQLPFFVLFFSLFLTGLAAYFIEQAAWARDRLQFEAATGHVQISIQEQIGTYTALVRGAAGLFVASEEVSHDEFRNYVERLRINELYPGIQGIGFAKRVDSAERDAVTKFMREKQGVSNFQMTPDDSREIYFPIVYLQPEDRRNLKAIGFDMFSEPIRRAAMERSRDAGTACISGRVILVQEIDEQKQAGFLIYAPVFDTPRPPDSVEERRNRLKGFVYSPFRAGDLFGNIIHNTELEQLNILIYDGENALPENLLYDSADLRNESIQQFPGNKPLTKTIEVLGRKWRLDFFERISSEQKLSGRLMPFVLMSGLLVSFLLFVITRSQINALTVAENAVGERQKLLQSEQDARHKAEEANRLKDEFLATVSHELRTPLNAILGWSVMLRKRLLGPDDAEHALETIERNARAQGKIIDDLLDVSRIITGRLRLEIEPVNLVGVIEEAREGIRPAATAKGITLETSVAPDAALIFGDSSRIQQIIWNLLSNAVKFTPAGGHIGVTVEAVGQNVEIKIKDTGEGIAPEFLPYVFDRFRQQDSATTRRHSGLGLGLSIVKQLAEMHGGNVKVYSEGSGRGSTFTVTLPQERIVPPDLNGAPEMSGQIGTNGGKALNKNQPLKNLRILLVEDVEDSRELMQLMLEQQGAEVMTAESVREAVQKLSNNSFDVLVSDIGMPGEDGYELIGKVRAAATENGNSRVPAIAITGFAREEDRSRAIAEGFDDHIAKPIDIDALTNKIVGLMSRVKN